MKNRFGGRRRHKPSRKAHRRKASRNERGNGQRPNHRYDASMRDQGWRKLAVQFSPELEKWARPVASGECKHTREDDLEPDKRRILDAAASRGLIRFDRFRPYSNGRRTALGELAGESPREPWWLKR